MGKNQKSHHFARLKKDFRLFPFVLGIFLGFHLPHHVLRWQEALILLFATLLTSYRLYKKERKQFLNLLLGLSLGAISYALLVFTPYPAKEGSYFGLVLESKENYFLFLSRGKRFIVYEEGNLYEAGDLLRIEGLPKDLRIAHYEGRFSFESYLHDKGVSKELLNVRTETIFHRPIRPRGKILAYLNSFEEPTKGLLSALLFGIRDYDSEAISLGESLHILHLLSVSGLYFALYKRFLLWFYGLFPWKRKGRAELATFLSLLVLFPFGIRKIGIIRILFVSFFEFRAAKKGKERPERVRLNSLLSLFLFLFDPFLFLSQGFLLSFGISFFFLLLKSKMRGISGKKRKFLSFLYLTLFLLPLHMAKGEIYLLSPILSYLLMPLFIPFSFLGYIGFFFLPWREALLSYSTFLLRTLSFFEGLPLRLPLYGPFLDFTPLFYALLFFGYSLSIRSFGRISEWGSLLSLILYLLSMLPVTLPSSWSVHFIDVGQGDAILIRVRNESMLLDTGGVRSFDMAKEVLIPYLRKEGVHRLSALSVTHNDFDHMGAKESLLSNFEVERVLEKGDYPYRLSSVLLKNHNPEPESEKDKNKGSLVLSFSLGPLSFLLMGDAPKEVEMAILKREPELNCDILKVGHHGSKTSSSLPFLISLSPKEAVISCGVGNRYGHPERDVLLRLEEVGAKIRRTDIEGTIVYRGFL